MNAAGSLRDAPEPLTLESLTARHRQIARYRLIVTDWSKPRGQQVTELERGLTYADALARCEAANAELRAAGKNGWTAPMYGLELTNGWECMSELARARQLSLGKKRGDYER